MLLTGIHVGGGVSPTDGFADNRLDGLHEGGEVSWPNRAWGLPIQGTMPTIVTPLLVAAAALAMCSCSSSRDSTGKTGADSAQPEHVEVSVSNEGVFIDHNSCGGGDTTLLFVHGWAIDQSYWSSQVDDFCPDYHVVTIDLPGHGRSGKNRKGWTVEDYAGDVRAVIDQLHLENVVLVGHSMAGNISLEAALNNDKVLAVVGVDNFKGVAGAYSDEMKARIADFIHQLRTDFDETAEAYVRRGLFQPTTDSAVVRRVLQSVEEVDSAVAAETMAGVFEYAPKAGERLSQLGKPLYLINSSAGPTDEAALRATGVTVTLLDVGPTGHYPMLEDPQAFDTRLRQVLQDIGTARRR